MRSSLVLCAALAVTLGACSDTPTAPTPATEVSAAKPGFATAAKPSGSTIAQLASGFELVVDGNVVKPLATLLTVISLSDSTCGTDFAGTLDANRGQFTVFAPVNEAFDPVFDILADLPVGITFCDVVPTVLAYHVTRGRHHSNSVLNHDRFRMLSGEYAAVDASVPSIGGAELNVSFLDISASNGIVHVVNDVLLPPSIVAALAQ